MRFSSQFIDFHETGYFSTLVTDFLKDRQSIRPFYEYDAGQPDFAAAISARQQAPVNRELLEEELRRQYRGLDLGPKLQTHLSLIRDENTFTVCTAHQPNIFTGYLYFIYKILHTIRLAEHLKAQHPRYNFVPVYYMGSEDNDLDELGKINLDGRALVWSTHQKGAVGRMKTEGLLELISQIEDRLGTGKHASHIIALLKAAYLEHADIQSATLYLVNALFGKYGLVVVIADRPGFKKSFLPVLKEELLESSSFPIVRDTLSRLEQHYAVQAHPREINLFYLVDGIRERIIRENDRWKVLNTGLSFTREEMLKELEAHPERFSPNVILRGLFQESILPNLAFIGGGGELAYWLELKELFRHFRVPYPVLLLRSSFLWIDGKTTRQLEKLDLEPAALFHPAEKLIGDYVQQHTSMHLALREEYETTERLYAGMEAKAVQVDPTLAASVRAERARALKSIGKVEHKFLRAEKKKFTWQTEQIRSIRARLFPGNALQERVDNFLPYYATYGEEFFTCLYQSLHPLDNRFNIILNH